MNYTSEDFYNYVKELFELEEDQPLPQTYIKQINKFIMTYDVSYLEFGRILYYCHDVLNKKFDKQFGISLNFGLYKNEALEYINKQLEEKEKRKKDAEKITFVNNNIIFNIKPTQQTRRKIKQIDISLIDVGEDINGS